MKIYRPVKTDLIFQGFGENLACCATDTTGKVIRPFKVIPGTYTGTCPVNSTKFYPAVGMKGHNGADMGLYRGEPIFFNAQANTRWQVINEIDIEGGIGVNVYALDPVPFPSLPVHEPGQFRMIEAQYRELNGKLYPMFKFWHLLSTAQKDRAIIKTGDVIGYGDSTGSSSGDHLHFGFKIHNGSGFSIDSDNGYTGALDHTPYYENKFILDVVTPSKAFTKTMRRGDVSTDVGLMQVLLIRHGFMQPIKEDEVGFFGAKTQKAVFDFQLKHTQLSYFEKTILRGSLVGPKTLEALNKVGASGS